MIEIDGSYGEGGGQILRTALSLSCIFRKPFRMVNIREGRKKPGLMPQHLASVRATQLLCHAAVTGDHAGSMELTFIPGEVRGGSFFFDIGTAGSAMLVLQTLIPPLIFTGKKTELILKGGTHVPFSPSFHYVNEIFVPVLAKLGVRILLSIESYGFYPKGGGKIRAEIFPAREIKPLTIVERGTIVALKGCSGVANLPFSIADRQRKALLEKIRSVAQDIACLASVDLLEIPAPGAGTFVFLKAESEHSLAGFTALGERGKQAEAVGEEAGAAFIDYYVTGAAIGPHLSDQLVLYLSMSNGTSDFTTSRITPHLLTNLWVIGLFHEFRSSIHGETGKPGRVTITSPRS